MLPNFTSRSSGSFLKIYYIKFQQNVSLLIGPEKKLVVKFHARVPLLTWVKRPALHTPAAETIIASYTELLPLLLKLKSIETCTHHQKKHTNTTLYSFKELYFHFWKKIPNLQFSIDTIFSLHVSPLPGKISKEFQPLKLRFWGSAFHEDLWDTVRPNRDCKNSR